MPFNPVFRLPQALLLALALVLAGCGFRLAGTADLPDYLSRIYLETANMDIRQRQELESRLRGAGAEIVFDSDSIVTRLDVRLLAPLERRIATSASSGRTVSRISRILEYDLRSPDGKPLEATRTLRQERDITLDDDNLLGSSEEIGSVAKELENNLYNQLVRNLSQL